MQPDQLYREGHLQQAIESQLAMVKKNPTDLNSRFFLAELLAFEGSWERVDKQLDAIIMQSKDAAVHSLLFRQLVRAEIVREQVFVDGRVPEIVVPIGNEGELQLRILTSLRGEAFDEAASQINDREAASQSQAGCCDGQAFQRIQDMDDRLGGIAEFLTSTGKYFWVPWSSIRRLRFHPPERPFDLLWRKASVVVSNGPEGDVYIPARYPKVAGWNDSQKLGRATDWNEPAPGIFTGLGQRMISLDDSERSIMEIIEYSVDLA